MPIATQRFRNRPLQLDRQGRVQLRARGSCSLRIARLGRRRDLLQVPHALRRRIDRTAVVIDSPEKNRNRFAVERSVCLPRPPIRLFPRAPIHDGCAFGACAVQKGPTSAVRSASSCDARMNFWVIAIQCIADRNARPGSFALRAVRARRKYPSSRITRTVPAMSSPGRVSFNAMRAIYPLAVPAAFRATRVAAPQPPTLAVGRPSCYNRAPRPARFSRERGEIGLGPTLHLMTLHSPHFKAPPYFTLFDEKRDRGIMAALSRVLGRDWCPSDPSSGVGKQRCERRFAWPRPHRARPNPTSHWVKLEIFLVILVHFDFYRLDNPASSRSGFWEYSSRRAVPR